MPSAKVLQQKKRTVIEIADTLKNAAAGVLVDYRGLTVEQDTALRRKLREAGVKYSVVKNTLTRFASKEVGLDGLDPILHGPTSLATSDTDVILPAKVIADFAKDNEALEIKAGFVDGKVISVEEVMVYATIPSREVLLSKMLGCLINPISSFARVIDAIAKQKESGVPAVPVEEAPVAAVAEEAPAAVEEAAPAEEVAAAEEAAPVVEEAPAEEAAVEEAPAEEVVEETENNMKEEEVNE